VLSYLAEPAILLAELKRLLRPGGRIMVSSMKPHCDMSTIYRDFMDQGVSGSELQSARNLLSAAGQIKIKEEQGYYMFYSGDQLVEMLQAAGFHGLQVFTSFGNQAVVVRGSA
jgi:ubiquinone/menaquinone biosynthesis C-methylase UbiE